MMDNRPKIRIVCDDIVTRGGVSVPRDKYKEILDRKKNEVKEEPQQAVRGLFCPFGTTITALNPYPCTAECAYYTEQGCVYSVHARTAADTGRGLDTIGKKCPVTRSTCSDGCALLVSGKCSLTVTAAHSETTTEKQSQEKTEVE